MSSAEDYAAASGNPSGENPGDIEMGENAPGAVVIEIDASAGTEIDTNLPEEDEEASGPELQETAMEDMPARVTYIDYLKSPIIGLLVGQGDEQALLHAHQALLCKSPWFEEACGKFSDDVSEKRIDLIDEDLDAVGCFLEYLYTNDYFPRKIPGSRDLEHDPAMPDVDESGDQLLKHARVYTLAEMLQLPSLKCLASSKIHCINSTAKGEIAYARYVYAHTQKDDQTIRAPVANFWATRSHTLRSEAETEFREMCLEFPQFGYDVLTRVLDEKLKREKNEKMHPSHGTPGSSRKRSRQSGI
ncbi:hypothetical protein SS1G_08940 [Sclerotinia sclerotiorum 1980 UF-70]|uniref:BTB domain-containing protein n=2 Tax=Sclerotinia sclerotiorum (strain ATCC 18683 / 1980 / Ss-1) TaxID=665079 RepID=A7EUD3_SCLS1|nr:hypothetical protein SS1G_08940 [Sclerotinia sclerotiorum 1980 UF-70]APA15304.1 hypothetical protein sscle_14g100740 [Sclerotinia sclerotiorum 1980 UF-70]EDN93075.1 hypothetical protein SS1G_08940 [Sclerotinia sclerotiorum 1980 UF-70]